MGDKYSDNIRLDWLARQRYQLLLEDIGIRQNMNPLKKTSRAHPPQEVISVCNNVYDAVIFLPPPPRVDKYTHPLVEKRHPHQVSVMFKVF